MYKRPWHVRKKKKLRERSADSNIRLCSKDVFHAADREKKNSEEVPGIYNLTQLSIKTTLKELKIMDAITLGTTISKNAI